MPEEKEHPPRFSVELENVDLTDEQVKQIQNDIVKTALDRVRALGPEALKAFKQFVSFNQWKSFNRSA